MMRTFPRDLLQWVVPFTFTAFTVVASVGASAADTKSETDFSAELPKIAPKTPEESLRAIRLKHGFHAERVASEPLIRSPMAMDFDEFGNAFVVELPEYNQYASPVSHGKGAIKRLVDTDGDGRFDTATVYVDELDYPTAVACWNGGVLVGVAPDLLFCKDTDGDGKADVRQKLFTGFGQDKAGEGMLNSIRWRFDNRFQISTGLDGGDIRHVTDIATGNDAAPGKPINVRGQNLLLDPRTTTLEATSGGGQHGMSLDNWNLHTFVCGNSDPVNLLMYDGRYIARNPYLQAPAASVNIAPDGKFTKLMRVSAVEPWRILRTRLRSQGAIPGSDEGGTPSGFFTGATGVTVYRGDAWPAEFLGQVFVGEVANNLIYRARLEPRPIGLTAHRADTDAEFLASSDNWFRPVQFANAPDGNLYVLDMYRELIEGAAFLAPQILKHMDTTAGYDKGRIYRIARDDFQFKPVPRLGELPTEKLVELLEHPNSWHRDTASRLIYERQDPAAVAPLKELAASSPSALARVMAMYSLHGLGSLEPSVVIEGLGAAAPMAREHALRMAEQFHDRNGVWDAVVRLVDDVDPRVRYQVAFTLGAFTGMQVTTPLKQIAIRDGADPWMQLAVLSSIGRHRGEFLTALLQVQEDRDKPHVRAMIASIAAQIGAAGAKEDIRLLLNWVNQLSDAPADQALAEDLVRNLVSKHPAISEFLSDDSGHKAKQIIATMIGDAEKIAADEGHATPERLNAIKTLGIADFARVKESLANLLVAKQPQPVQTAAMETLARFPHDDVPALILSVWSGQTPPLRASAVEALFTRPKWISLFLNAVENQTIAVTELDPARVALLKKHNDPMIRERAEKLFAESAISRRNDVVQAYQTSLDMAGDVERGRAHFRKTCAACHKLEGVGESIGADLNAIRDRGTAAVMLNILDPNREVKPQFFSYVVVLDSGRTLTGMIVAETANSLTLRKPDNSTETVLRVNIDEIKTTGLSFMPEGLEKQLDTAAMADLLAYLNATK
jgi:putative membrane-bound dehydrogenase-like protein